MCKEISELLIYCGNNLTQAHFFLFEGWKYGWKIEKVQNKKALSKLLKALCILFGVPKGIRTPVAGVKGRFFAFLSITFICH